MIGFFSSKILRHARGVSRFYSQEQKVLSPNILLLPGMLNTKRVWENQALELVKQGIHVYYGSTFKGNSLREMAMQNMAFLPQKEGVINVGAFSMGCHVLAEMMAIAPELNWRCIFVSPAEGRASPFEARRKNGIMRKYDASSDADFIADLSRDFFIQQTASRFEWTDEKVLIFREMAIQTGRVQFIRQLKATLAREDLGSCLEKMVHQSRPFIIFKGVDDKITPRSGLRERFSKEAPHSFIDFPECGHLITFEKSKELNALMKNFILNGVPELQDKSMSDQKNTKRFVFG